MSVEGDSLDDKLKKKIIEKVEKKARLNVDEYHQGCAQCSLNALQEVMGLGDNQVLKSSSSLSGGICMHQRTCGAVTGGLMAINLVYGLESMEDDDVMMDSMMGPGRKFIERFEEEWGTSFCDEIIEKLLGQKYDISKEEEYEAYCEAGGYEKSKDVIGDAARIAAEIILEEKYEIPYSRKFFWHYL